MNRWASSASSARRAEPFATPLGDVAVALMAGNGVVLKPSPRAPLCGERIARVFARAGLPEGLLQVVHGHTDAGAALVAAPVAQIRFTGSARAGREVGEACARGLKRSVLALDGKDAMLVLADAHVPRAVRGATWAAFANAGQCGGSVERALCVARSTTASCGVVDAARRLPVGDPADRRPNGPLVARGRAERVRALVDEAVAAGATLHCGGALQGADYVPTVLSGVTATMRLAREEVPGRSRGRGGRHRGARPIARANAATLGLGASVWTADRYKGARIARELRVGMVWMNDHLVARSAPQIPWGGVGGAGIGRARGAIALRTCAEPRVVRGTRRSGPGVVVSLRRRACRGRARSRWARSARDRDRERAWRRDGVAPLRVTGRWLRRRGARASRARRAPERGRRARWPPRRCSRSRPGAVAGPRAGWRRPRPRARTPARGRRRCRLGRQGHGDGSPAAAPPTSWSGRCSAMAATSGRGGAGSAGASGAGGDRARRGR